MNFAPTITAATQRTLVSIPVGPVELKGELEMPGLASGVVLFAHGSGSSRFSPRNQCVARVIRDAGIGTLLFDLLTIEEEAADEVTKELRFDIGMLAGRLAAATQWLLQQPEASDLRVGYFGASTGGAAALVAAARLGARVGAVVSRGGRPDLAGSALPQVQSPTLLIVGGCDALVLSLNRKALEDLRCEKELRVVPRATHLFQEPGKLEQVARISADWFRRHLAPPATEETA